MASQRRPNVLYIHSHDTGRYIQPYGYAVPTPHMQRLAEQGVLFRQAFCAGPTCSPSRAALLTGQCAHSAGMIGLAHRNFRLADMKRHLAHTLHDAGYHCTLAGQQHVALNTQRGRDGLGYDEVLDVTDTHVAATAPAAAAWLAAGPREPFFLSVGFAETHRRFHPPGPQEDPRYCRPPAPLPDTPQTREDMAAFIASARVYDEGVGTVLAALDAAGLADNTLVINTTDHGIAFPGMKCTLTDHGIGVMLIMRAPGGFVGGQVSDAMVSHVDVFPTLCEVLRIDPPAWLQGRSMMPLIRGDADQINDEVFAEVTYHAAYQPMRAVRTRRWKYIRHFDGRSRPVLPNCDDSPSKKVWLAHGWRERPVATEELYDLIFDPNEAHNLATDPDAAALTEMRGRLDEWMKRTDDPLLAGQPVPAPSGAAYNDPDGLSPGEKVLTAP